MATSPVSSDEADYSVYGRPIEAGALYTVEERLETFNVPYCNWPYDSGSCTPLKASSRPLGSDNLIQSTSSFQQQGTDYYVLSVYIVCVQLAEAGFYFCGTAQMPDWVRCVVCHHNMEGWEATDNPL